MSDDGDHHHQKGNQHKMSATEAHSRVKQPHTPTKKRSRKPPKPFSPNDVYVHTITKQMAASCAGKSCSQCGATKTPQWREGPLGPKTLCNACGVKRVRAARAAMEGRMRMAKTTKKAVEPASTRRSTKGKSTAARAAAFILAAIEEKEKEDEPGSKKTKLSRGRPAPMAVDDDNLPV